jgi:hypothetical protein
MQQAVTVSGLGAADFAVAVTSINTVQSLFARKFKDGEIELWKPGHFDGFETITMSNRYFTEARLCEGSQQVAFHRMVDPNGALAAATGGTLFHIDDNDVKYLELIAEVAPTAKR